MATIDMGRKEGTAVPLSRELGPRLVQCGLNRGLLPYQAASSSIQPFANNRHGPKIGWSGCALFQGVAGFTSNTMSRRLREAYLRTKWHLDPCSRLATIDVGQKLGGLRPFLSRAGFPSNTKSPGLRPTSIPSGILMHPAVWPQ